MSAIYRNLVRRTGTSFEDQRRNSRCTCFPQGSPGWCPEDAYRAHHTSDESRSGIFAHHTQCVQERTIGISYETGKHSPWQLTLKKWFAWPGDLLVTSQWEL